MHSIELAVKVRKISWLCNIVNINSTCYHPQVSDFYSITVTNCKYNDS